MHVLYIDDSESDRVLAHEYFSPDQDYAIVCVSSTDLALDLLLESRFDMLVSDIIMPRDDGLLLGEVLKDKGIDMPYILISGIAVFEDFKPQTIYKNYLGFMLKPLTPKTLAAFLRTVKWKNLH